MNTLKVQTRDENEKAKRLRREGYITGNLYGKEIEKSILLKIERKEAERALKGCMKGTQILLDLNGKTYDVLIKDMDYDSMKNQLLEIDFQALVSNEKVHSVAEIVLENKEKVVEGVLEQLLQEVSYKAYPSALVDKVIVDVGNMRLGDKIKVKDLDIAKNKDIDLHTDPEKVVVSVLALHENADDEETDEAETPAK